MGKHFSRYRLGIILMTLLLMTAMIFECKQTIMAAKNKATTIRLVRTEGKVTVKNSKMEELVQTTDMRLSSGDHQITEESSYAWLSLDDAKAVKLDENSEAELRKKWRKLEVLLDSGSIFFNVTVPLESDEELNIRSATIVTGIRGTCGWVRVMDGGTTRVYLLEGKLECVVTNPVEGGTKTITLKPGEYADFIVHDPNQKGDTTDIVSGKFTEEDIEPYVLVELVDDEALVNKIYEQSGINLRNKTGEHARKKLQEQQAAQSEANNGIRGKAAQQDNVIAKDPVWNDGDPDDSIVYLTMPQTAATVQGYLDMERVKRVVLLPGEGNKEDNTLRIDIAFDVLAGKTLEARERVDVFVEKKNSFAVNGTAEISSDLTNEGSLFVKSSHTLRVMGMLYNHGHFENTATGRVVLSGGMISSDTFINAGIVEASDGASGQALITIAGGEFSMSDGKIVSGQFDTIVKVEEGANAVLSLTGGNIANEREGAAALLVSEGDFRVSGLGTDVMGITDTLLGQNADLAKYNAASVYRTDERYHLISLDSVESYPVLLGNFLHGYVSVPDRVEVGARVPLVAVPDKGYQLESLTANLYNGAEAMGAEVSLAADQSFIMPNHDVIINAIFVAQGSASGNSENGLYQVNVKETTGGKVTATPQKANAGEEVLLQVVIDDGYELEKLSAVDDAGDPVGLTVNGNEYVLSMPIGGVTVEAVFKALQYQVVFYDEGGKTVLNKQTLDYGAVPVYKGVEPSKAPTKKFKYVFAGWKEGNREYTNGGKLPAVSGDMSFTAVYREEELTESDLAKLESYTVNWVDWDGTVLRTDKNVAKGTVPSYGANTPTRNADAQYTYSFNGWNSGSKKYSASASLPAVTGNVTYTAEYTSKLNSYTVKWKNWDGTELKSEQVSYGKVPSYSGNTPARATDAQNIYTFSGWSPAVVAVTGNVTYTATFSTTAVVHVSGIALNQKTITLQPGGSASLSASILPDAAMNKNVSWSSSDSSVVGVSGNGLSATVTAKKDGTATIVVTTADGNKTDTCVVTVRTAVSSVSLNKTAATMGNGDTLALTATITPSTASNQNVTWSSSNTSVATVSGSGLSATVTAKGYGTATITVKTADGNKTASCTVTIPTPVSSVSLSSSSLDMKTGGTATLTATINPTSATNKNVTWSTDNSNVATVSSSGVVTAKGNGRAVITVTTEDGGKTASCTVSVTTAVTGVSLNKTSTSINVGGSETLTATVNPGTASNKNVTWSTSNSNVATVSSNGVVTGVSKGSATITVTTADGGKTASCTVTVIKPVTGITLNEDKINLVLGRDTFTLTATVTPADASDTSVTWSSSNTSIATVSNGTVVPKKAGVVTITAKSNSNSSVQASCSVTVTGYTVSWYMNENSSAFAKDTGVAYGTVPSRSGPAMASTDQYDYTFNGWRSDDGILYTGALPRVTGDVSYCADYTAVERTFTVTWKDWDGTTLRTDTNVAYGTRLGYNGTNSPIRASDNMADYTFTGWSDGTQTFGVANGYPEVKADVTYTATYYANVKQYDYWFFYTISGGNANGMQFLDAGTSITCPASAYKWKRQSDGAIFSPGDVIILTDNMFFDEYNP